MLDRPFLVGKVVNSLLKEGYEVLLTEGAFDIVAKRDQIFILKVLPNIDALKEDQAMSLRAVSYFMAAYPIIISARNNRENLDHDMVYSRFGVSVMTPYLFEETLKDGDMSVMQSAKGRHTMEIDSDLLRSRRKELGMTLEDLSQKVGISKKALYEIENRRVNPTEDTVEKLESIIVRDLKTPYNPKPAPMTYLKPKTSFQSRVGRELKRMGIDNSPVYSAPFDVVGKEDFILITKSNPKNTEKEVTMVKKFSGMLSTKAMFVAKKYTSIKIDGVPVILESELTDIGSSKDLKKIIDEKE